MNNSYQQEIVCPECDKVQMATVERKIPFDSYVHHCECGYIITESDWTLSMDWEKKHEKKN